MRAKGDQIHKKGIGDGIGPGLKIGRSIGRRLGLGLQAADPELLLLHDRIGLGVPQQQCLQFIACCGELEEAARLDGCSQFGVFWRIVLPLAKPALATLAIFTLLGSWNDLIWPLISISDDRWYTLQLGLANFQGTRRTQWQLLMAGNVVATVPLVAFFLIAQKHFIATMTFSGLKG